MLNRFGKIRQDYEIAIKEALRLGLEICEFHNECNDCKNPQHGSFASGSGGHEMGYEVDFYVCGKCVLKARSKHYKIWVKYGIKAL